MALLTGLKVSSLVRKCVNLTDLNIMQRGRDPMELNFEGFEMQN